jgi:hypothetical protein
MAGIACDLRFSAKPRSVQVDDHLHHLACPALRQLVVTIPHPAAEVRRSPGEIGVGLDVTVIAPHAQGRGDEIHEREELRLWKRLQHLELRSLLAGRAGLLRRGGSREGQRQNAPVTGHE